MIEGGLLRCVESGNNYISSKGCYSIGLIGEVAVQPIYGIIDEIASEAIRTTSIRKKRPFATGPKFSVSGLKSSKSGGVAFAHTR